MLWKASFILRHQAHHINKAYSNKQCDIQPSLSFNPWPTFSHQQGAIGSLGLGDGIWAQAATDPVNGRSMITEDASDPGRYRLTDEAAVRESKYQRESHRNPDAIPLSYLDYSKNPEASPSSDSGSFVLGKLGVRL